MHEILPDVKESEVFPAAGSSVDTGRDYHIRAGPWGLSQAKQCGSQGAKYKPSYAWVVGHLQK